MELKSYIESGILEAYILGECSPTEREEVERMAAQHPEIKAEISNIETTLESFAKSQEVETPLWMKDRILTQIEAEKQAYPQKTTDNIPEIPAKPESKSLKSNYYTITKPVGFVLMFLGTLLWMRNWQLNFESWDAEKQIKTLTTQVNDCQTKEQNLLKSQEQAIALTDKNTRPIVMPSADGKDASLLSTVFYNPVLKKAFFNPQTLPAIVTNEDYQVWVVTDKNPNPQPLDVVPSDSKLTELAKVRFDEKVVAFAVSVEPKGGSPNGKPTKVILLGKV